MSISVLSASSTANLIRLATVKERLGIEVSDTSQDALLASMIDGASSAISSHLDRELGRQQYEESFFPVYRERLLLSRFPVDPDSVTLELDGVAYTDFLVEETLSGVLYRQYGFPATCGEQSVVVEYTAGWVLPDQIQAYAAGLVLAVGDWLRPTKAVKDLLFEVTTAGTTAGAEPTWPTTAGGTVSAGGTVVVTARRATELPAVIRDCAWLVVQSLHGGLAHEYGVASMRAEAFQKDFFQTAQTTGLPTNVMHSLARFRHAA